MSWQPEIGDEVRLCTGQYAEIVEIDYPMYCVRYKTKFGMTSGWYTRE
jgi:hypothetical protein